jgi:hypothetical protein
MSGRAEGRNRTSPRQSRARLISSFDPLTRTGHGREGALSRSDAKVSIRAPARGERIACTSIQ